MAMSIKCAAEPLRVFMTGDSHVTSKLYPNRVKDILLEEYPEIEFSYWGKVGQSFKNYSRTPEMMNRIVNADPDVLIVHMGTNDSYFTGFDPVDFTKDVTKFYNEIKRDLPDCEIIFVTPFFNKLRNRKTGKWEVNEMTRVCADALLEFSETHPDTYVVDNNAEHGIVFLDGGASLIRSDNVHLTAEGYELLGEQVGLSLVEIFKDIY